MKQLPPSIFLRFFRWYSDPAVQPYIEGDLLEVYAKRARKRGKKVADLLFVIDVLLLFRPGIIRPLSNNRTTNNSGMIKNYVTISFRSILKNRLHSTLNISGLTLGIVCFLLISLYVFDELTFDQQHSNFDRIFRVVETRSVKGDVSVIAAGPFRLAEESKTSIPEVEMTSRMQRQGRANLVDPENPVPFQETVTMADENFLQVFDFPLLQGDARTALKEPASIVINEELAMRIFNRTDVMGRNLQFSHLNFPLKITGILAPIPRNSSFNFNSLFSESTYYNFDFFKNDVQHDWESQGVSIYAVLRPGSDPVAAAEKMTNLVKANSKPLEGTTRSFALQALKDMHLRSAGILDGARNGNVDAIPQGNPLYITIFSFVAFFVLLISAINYTNLTTARASGRIKEIGVRKAIGAMRSNLIWQFLFESVLTTAMSFVLAVGIVAVLLPPFNQFANKQISLIDSADYRFWLTTVGLIAGIALLSGSYAALLLSRLRPVALLKGLKVQSSGDLSVRKILVVFQFTISVVMIIGTIVLLMQVKFINNSDLGFNKDLMVVIDVNTGAARRNFEAIKEGMSKVAAVRNVSVSSRVPGEWKDIRQVKIKTEGSSEEPVISFAIGADKDFLPTYEIKLLQGRNFDTRNDSMAVIINETAAKMLGITEASSQAVEIPAVARDAEFTPFNQPFKPRVVGIVKDFHFQSLRAKIQPLVLAYNKNPIHVIDYYSVRIEPTNIQETLDQLKAVMVKNDPKEPFEYHFLDDQLALFYVEDERRQSLLTWVAITTIFIACMGLFGLATYATEQRVKEIGVRKVLGASVVGLVGLLSRDFIKLVLIAAAIAFPIAWWGTDRWLQEYAYHVEVGWGVFVLAGLMAVGIAFFTISYQAIKTAVTSPVHSLRSE
ncbi:MAG TPA: ABC transporter permease [Cyclobacteriaceae bacterium]|nr:ABC transporter permease [Cyclobacteriaceae bacterium]